jgi:biotin/methionine sulfoxide reductase
MTVKQDLPLTAAHWGTYRARVSQGRVQELIGFEHDSDPSPIGAGMIDVQHGPNRINAPMIRKAGLRAAPAPGAICAALTPMLKSVGKQPKRLWLKN